MRRPLLIALALAACLAAAGCYKKVVGAQGFGADRGAIENGNAPPDKGTRTLGYPKYNPKSLPGE